MIKECTICGDEFNTENRKGNYCSIPCRNWDKKYKITNKYRKNGEKRK